MTFYQREHINYKLECENNPDTSLAAFYEQFTPSPVESSSLKSLLEYSKTFSIIALCLLIILPSVGIKYFVIVLPVVLVIVGIFYVKQTILLFAAASELQESIDEY